MVFRPVPGQQLVIDGVPYTLAQHPHAPGMVYGQEGRQATVYMLAHGAQQRALKVFKPRFRVPSLASLADRLNALAGMAGLAVCRRTVLTARNHGDLLRAEPDLTYAVLMPWVAGETWMEIVAEQRPLAPGDSLIYARAAADALTGLEERGVAHCDLSGPNLLVTANGHGARGVEFVDVEQMYGPGFDRPETLPAGSAGYAHCTAGSGLWSRTADRFAGAVLIAELLGWCDPRVRQAAWGENYFDPAEMQRNTQRFGLLRAVLEERWGAATAETFARAWHSTTLDECPTFGEWLVRLPDGGAARPATAVPFVMPWPNGGAGNDAAVAALRQRSDQLVASGDTLGALAALREALDLVPAGNRLRGEISRRAMEIQSFGAPARAVAATPPPAYTAPLAQATVVAPAPAAPLPVAPVLGGGQSRSRGEDLARVGLVSVVVAAFLVLFMLAAPNLTEEVRQQIANGGWVTYDAVGSGLLALLVGLLRVAIFRNRLTVPRALVLTGCTVAGGVIGGAVGGALVQGGAMQPAEAGWIIGALAGATSAAGELTALRNHGAALARLLWSTAIYAVAWGLAWTLNGQVTESSSTTTGLAVGVCAALLIAAVTELLFLALFREVEF